MSGTNFTEVGLLWKSKTGKSAASGHITTACDVVLKPGQRIIAQPIEYQNGKPSDKAPDYKLVVVWDFAGDREERNGQTESGDAGGL